MAAKAIFRSFEEIGFAEKQETRKGFGDGCYELMAQNKQVVALTADLGGSLRLNKVMAEYKDRFIQVGVAEANMIGIAAGLTIGGHIPIATTFANFATSRVYDQIRQSVAYSNKPVKICASHAGLTLGEDGATHQVLEDVGMMRMLPGMTVIVPGDYRQTKAATLQLADIAGPVYMRFGRPKWPVFYPEDYTFTCGKADLLVAGTDVTIVANGHMVWTAIEAGKVLESKGISVELLNLHTVKPFDDLAVLASVSKTKCVVTAEEHQQNGGLGDAVANLLSRKHPVPHEYVAVHDVFGESGKPEELLAKYGLHHTDIIAASQKVLHRKPEH